MRRLAIISCLTGIVALFSCSTQQPADIAIVPIPESTVMKSGSFNLTKNTTVGYTDASLKPAAEYLASLLRPATGYAIEASEGEGDITLSLSGNESGNDAYRLTVTPDKVTITGDTYGGVIAGIQSLRQLLPPQIESAAVIDIVKWTIPAVDITDAPRYGWRGIMLDVSRHFFTKEEVKELIELMSMYKMNRLHWHLTDDQGWRVEIKKYPLLTEKGAWRKLNEQDRECLRRAAADKNSDYLLPSDRIRVENGDTLYGGYYTQADIREIVDFASVRGIEIIPEIDMPGHFLAAASNYSGVACFDETGWGKSFSSPVCPGKDTALEFCKNIYSELIDLFPGRYVHIGGDEVEKTNWKKCRDCRKRMTDNGLKSEEQLQAWFISQMENMITSKGKKMIGWDEITEGGLSETSTVMWWRSWSANAPIAAAQHGNDIILCPNAQFYLDYAEDRNSIPNIYNFDAECPIPDSLRHRILGVQGNIWSECIPTAAKMQHMAMPRLLAIAELGWSKPDRMNLSDFRQRLASQFERLNIMGISYHIPELEGFHAINAFTDNASVSVSCLDPTAIIRYTTDGSEPTEQSARYTSPLTVSETTDFIFRTFRPDGTPCEMTHTAFRKESPAPATTVGHTSPGLTAAWHEFTGDRCAAITEAPLNGTYTTTGVEIPHEAKGKIGLVITGYIIVPDDGIYTFDLLSDDGSTLNIDGATVVDNDGAHAPVRIAGQKSLAKGAHPIEVRYFDQNGGELKLRVIGPDGQELPPAELYRH